MAISTRDLEALPDVAPLKRLLQAMAMLDAILQPDWQYRYYSFNALWAKGQMMGSMRNCQGDEFFALFNNHGVFLKGFVHESPMARIPSKHFYRDLPREFDECRREAAFSPEDVTFCLWRLIGQPAWSYGKVDFPLYEDVDGSAYILSMLDGAPGTYRSWAGEYYERDVPIRAIETIYRHQPLTEELVFALNPQQSLEKLGSDIAEIGYPG
jgi:hypothetical protein